MPLASPNTNLPHRDVTIHPRGLRTFVPFDCTTMNTQATLPATERFRFTTTGITCGGCANSVRTILGRLPGVLHVQVDLAGHTAEVEVERGSITPENLAAALKPSGFALIHANA